MNFEKASVQQHLKTALGVFMKVPYRASAGVDVDHLSGLVPPLALAFFEEFRSQA